MSSIHIEIAQAGLNVTLIPSTVEPRGGRKSNQRLPAGVQSGFSGRSIQPTDNFISKARAPDLAQVRL